MEPEGVEVEEVYLEVELLGAQEVQEDQETGTMAHAAPEDPMGLELDLALQVQDKET